MSISDYNEEEVEEMSAIELAHILLEDEKKPYEYGSLMNRIAELKDLSSEETKNRQTKLFTSMNLDGRFVHLGENHWGLRGWYPLDQSDEDLSTTVKMEDTKKNQEPADEFEEDFDDNFEDIEDELDELSQEENAEDEEKTKPLDGFEREEPEEPEDDDSY
ncbi:DNA-directed RNA polymerase subunit delta [Salibacterium qingdaonense]|uniref:Probable DNA-directed RNA polymerase subunit delta n=1 Tax=Salibacterium qingdaonense TaxID=266892 RepID=A0A1I4L9S9_9BACI|nr:DNA-directed RNA polymerase subunit delta [Salibacterium qingdaonense]SFL87795.1 DNA-directed RNA polymerase subunit delta [Salibacterium qingdaonense]